MQLHAFKGSTNVLVQLMAFGVPDAKMKEALGKLMTIALTRVR